MKSGNTSTCIEDSHVDASGNKRSTRYSVWFLIIIGVTFICLFGPNILHGGAPRVLAPRDPVRLLNIMGGSDDALLEARQFAALPVLLELGENPENIPEFREAAQLDDGRGDYANFVLFKVRDEPQTRLLELLHRLETRSDNIGVIGMVLDELDSESDAEFVPELLNAARTDNETAKKVLIYALSNFPAEPGVLDFIIGASRDGSQEIRWIATGALGRIASVDEEYKQNPEILETLISVMTHDPDSGVRSVALVSLGDHGWNDRSSRAIRDYYLSGDVRTKKSVLHVISEMGPPSETIPILSEFFKDPDKQIKLATSLTIAEVIIFHYWLYILGLIMLLLTIYDIRNARKLNDGVRRDDANDR